MLSLNVKIAVRNIRKNPVFALINIGGLAIGLASCLLLLLYVEYEWSYDKQFKDINRIYFAKLNLRLGTNIITLDATPVKLAPAAAQEIPGIEIASRVSDTEYKLFANQQNKIKLTYNYVEPSFLKIFDYNFLKGNPQTALQQPNAIILTESAALKLYGNLDPVGQSLTWDNRKKLTVTAVIKDPPKNQSLQFEALQTWAFHDQEYPKYAQEGWGSINCSTIFKLKKNADFYGTDQSLRKLVKRHHPNTQMEVFLFPFSKYQLYDQFENGTLTGGRIDQVRLFFILALCVLLIASINYMNLSTARSEKRSREVGVKKALGSSRKALIFQFLMESTLLSLIAMAIAIALIEISLPYFNNLLEIVLDINYHSLIFWLCIVGLAIITGTLAGSYPAFYLSSFSPVKVLKGFRNTGTGSLSIRKLLVIFQFSLSIVMIIGATIVYSQIQYLSAKPLGFNQQNLIQLELEGDLRNPHKLELLKTTLKKEQILLSATEYAADFTANGGSITGDFNWPGKNKQDEFILGYRSIGFDFVITTGAKLISGKDFSRSIGSDTAHGVLINQAAAKMMQLPHPVGTSISWASSKLRILGVLKDYYNVSPGHQAEPTIFYYSPLESNSLLLRINPDQPLHIAVAKINKICQQLNPAYPPTLKFITEGMELKMKSEKLLGVLSNIFGIFAILISCLGLLGLALFVAEQRQREISIRKVLGANLQSILFLLNKDFLKLVLISNAIAFPIAYFLMSKWLQTYHYRVNIGFQPYLLAAGFSLVIAVFTLSIQTFKVAKANPVDALKYE